MGTGKKVLVIGRHAGMMESIVNMLKQNGYMATGETTNEAALATFRSDVADAVIIGGGVDSESRNLFHTEFLKINPAVILINAHPHTVLNDLKSAFND